MTKAAMAQVAASAHPGQWVKGETSEENLRKFNLWIEAYQHWTSLVLHGANWGDVLKWNLLIVTGGHHHLPQE